jgi:hypothetical protein
MRGQLEPSDGTDRSTLEEFSPAVSKESPLGALINRHRAGRSCSRLAEASDGVISPAQWEGLEQMPLWGVRPADPTVIEAIARALGLPVGTVMHYALASRPPSDDRQLCRIPDRTIAVAREGV